MVGDDLTKTRAILSLLQQTSTKDRLRDLLKSRQLHYSGGWDDLIEKRVLPAVTSHAISNDELLELLRSEEEYGKQHVFLFSCSSSHAADLIDRTRIAGILRSKGLESILTEPATLAQPSAPMISDVRWTSAKVDLSLTIKEVETRFHQRLVDESSSGNRFTKTWETVPTRAVNVAKLHRDGLLELRIAAHSNSTRYEADVRRFWRQIIDLVPIGEFHSLALSTAKERLLLERDQLSHLIRYNTSTLKDRDGNLLYAATSTEEGDLAHGRAISASIDAVLDDDGYCEESNFCFRKGDRLARDVRVVLGREPNEFVIRANCSEEEYEYVLEQLRFFNRPAARLQAAGG